MYLLYYEIKGEPRRRFVKSACIDKLMRKAHAGERERVIDLGYFYHNDLDWEGGTYCYSAEAAKAHGCLTYYGSNNQMFLPFQGLRKNISIGQFNEERGRPYVSAYHRSGHAVFSETMPKPHPERHADFFVGFEIEKAQRSTVLSITGQDFVRHTGWGKEWDSSLGDWGYELVSPIYDIMEDGYLQEIEEMPILKQHIEAKCNDRCGGHINISSRKHTPYGLYEGIKNYIPLLYTMYAKRMLNQYCAAKTFADIEDNEYSDGHYLAVKIKKHLIELRIFPKVETVKQLKWRVGLLRVMLNNLNKTEHEIIEMLNDSQSDLYKHLKELYTRKQIEKKARMYAALWEIFSGGEQLEWLNANRQLTLREIKEEYSEIYNAFLVTNSDVNTQEPRPNEADWLE